MPGIDRRYDVVVVGGGPAGLSSAKGAADSGAKVIVFEEHSTIGVPVQCGELFSRSALEELGMKVSRRWQCKEFHNVRMVSPGGKEMFAELPIDVPPPLFTIERKIWEKDVARLAARAGAQVVTRARVTDIVKKDGRVAGVTVRHMGQDMTVNAKVVIACDGPGSPIGRKAGLVLPRDPASYASIASCQMVGIDTDPDVGEVHFYPTPRDIYYILPKGNGYANIGYGTLGTVKSNAKSMLDAFIARDPRLAKGSIIETNVGVEPITGLHKEIATDGLLLVGDAAGMVNPITVAGMRFSVWAGVRAGRIAAEAARTGDVSKAKLDELKVQFLRAFGKRFRMMDTLRQVLFDMTPQDLDDMLAHLGRMRIPAKLFKGKKEPVFYPLRMMVGLLVKKPRFIGKFKPLWTAMREKDAFE